MGRNARGRGETSLTAPTIMHRRGRCPHRPLPYSLSPVGRGDHTPPPGIAPQLMKKPCHCEGAPRPWQSVSPALRLLCLRRLPFFLRQKKGRKERRQNQGFGILFAAGVSSASVSSYLADRDVQNLHLASAWPLRLIPRRATRLCWPGGTGKTSAPTVRRREGTPPYEAFCRAGPVCPAAPTDILRAEATGPMWTSSPTPEHADRGRSRGLPLHTARNPPSPLQIAMSLRGRSAPVAIRFSPSPLQKRGGLAATSRFLFV